MSRGGFVYILANQRRGTLYVGVTSDLVRRIHQHRTGETGGFTQRYHLTRLVYFERHVEIESAIRHEKQLKRWRRQWKIRLIEQENPSWRELWPTIV